MSNGVNQLRTLSRRSKAFIVAAIIFFVSALSMSGLFSLARAEQTQSRLITVYDRGETASFLTEAKRLDTALEEAGFILEDRDTVEPSRDEELVAPEYKVNIYRARPVVVIDGAVRKKTVTPYQTAQRIAKDVGIELYAEDDATISRSDDLVGDGAGLRLTVIRATPFIFDLYGSKNEARSQQKTVGAMLKEKGIILGNIDRVSVSLDTPLVAGMQLRVWREGIQTSAETQSIAFAKEFIYDADRPLGYRAVQTKGVEGVRTVTYEVEIKDGREVSRREIARLVTKNPSKQIDVIGIKGLESGLTKSKGAHYWTDSKGVQHRETYYDLNMRVVMQACGQGGAYSVRFDGAKIDSDGYVIIAANYGNYPRCSVVETSMGPGKVYDTGGFAVRHPHGFDLATDWTRADGI